MMVTVVIVKMQLSNKNANCQKNRHADGKDGLVKQSAVDVDGNNSQLGKVVAPRFPVRQRISNESSVEYDNAKVPM